MVSSAFPPRLRLISFPERERDREGETFSDRRNVDDKLSNSFFSFMVNDEIFAEESRKVEYEEGRFQDAVREVSKELIKE